MEKIHHKLVEHLTVDDVVNLQTTKLNKVKEILIHVRTETRIELANKEVQIVELQKQLRGYMQGCRVLTYTSSERENLRFFTLQVPEFQLQNLKNSLH